MRAESECLKQQWSTMFKRIFRPTATRPLARISALRRIFETRAGILMDLNEVRIHRCTRQTTLMCRQMGGVGGGGA